MNKIFGLTSAVLLSAAALVPAAARERPLAPVASDDVTRFVGSELYGAAHADLGVVSQADRESGLIGLTGKHGEFAVLDASLLQRDGLQMYAPDLSVGHIAEISSDNMSRPGMIAKARTGTITIEEEPYLEEFDQE